MKNQVSDDCTQICNAIEVRCAESFARHRTLNQQLQDTEYQLALKDKLSFDKYASLEAEANHLHDQIHDEEVKLSVWSEAREICHNIIANEKL